MAKLKYNETFPVLAEKYAKEGMTDAQIAKKLGIGGGTYYRYQKRYREFWESIKKGKSPVDDDVENALLKRALGYDYEEIMTEYQVKGKEEEKAKPVTLRRIKKFVIPDVTAQIFWLKNRRPDKWRDKHDFEFPQGVMIKIISAIPRSDRVSK